MSEHVSNLLDRYNDDELRPAARARVEAHLETCASCRRRLAELEQLSTLLRELPGAPVRTPPDRFEAQVRLRLPERRPMAAPRWLRIGTLALPAALIGAWAFVQAVALLAAAALGAVQLGWGRPLGLDPLGRPLLWTLLSGTYRGELATVGTLVRVEESVRWLALVPLQLMLAIAALYGLWIIGLYRYRSGQRRHPSHRQDEGLGRNDTWAMMGGERSS